MIQHKNYLLVPGTTKNTPAFRNWLNWDSPVDSRLSWWIAEKLVSKLREDMGSLQAHERDLDDTIVYLRINNSFWTI